MSIIDDVATKHGCSVAQVFIKAAVCLGWIDFEIQAAKWLAKYHQCRSIDKDVVDWCLNELYPVGSFPISKKGAVALKGVL